MQIKNLTFSDEGQLKLNFPIKIPFLTSVNIYITLFDEYKHTFSY